jgi:hypothetical protein
LLLVTQQTNAFRLLFGSNARRDEELNDAVRRVEDIGGGRGRPDRDRPVRRSPPGLWHRGPGQSHEPPLASSTVAEQLEGDQRAAEAQRLAAKVSELAWAALRGLQRDPSDR